MTLKEWLIQQQIFLLFVLATSKNKRIRHLAAGAFFVLFVITALFGHGWME